MDSYWSNYGTLNSGLMDSERCEENSSLWLVEYLLKNPDQKHLADLIKYYGMCKKDRPGLYDQLPFVPTIPNDAWTSHDQLTGLICASKKFGLNLHEDVWSEFKRQWFRYNNVNPPETLWQKLVNPAFYHPRDIIVYGMVAGCALWWTLYPILLIILIISQFGSDTSGKLLNWVRCTGFGWNKTLWILEKFMPYKSWKDVYAVYFPDPEHPINKLWE